MSLQRRSGAGKKEWRDSRGFGFTISPFVYLPWTWSHGIFSLLAFWLAYGLLFGLGGWLLVGQLFGLIQGVEGLLFGGLFGLLSGLALGLLFGMSVVGALNRAILRWFLRRDGLVPPHLERFLNYAADHVLLQSVGGGYQFAHMLLHDYFADLSPQMSGTDGTA